MFPGVPFVVIGRGPDFAWSATSSQADNIDLFVETLCGGDDHHYLFRGQCIAMQRFDAGVLRANGQPDQPVVVLRDDARPVVGYATVGGVEGRRFRCERSTRGRELLSAQGFYDLDTGEVTSPQTFIKAMSHVEFSFNWFYADDKHIAYYSSGRLPLRAPGTDPALPTIGSGAVRVAGLPAHGAASAGDRPAERRDPQLEQQAGRGCGLRPTRTSSYGSIQRVDLFTAEDREAEEAHARQRRLGDERVGDAGPPRSSACGRSSARCSTPARRRARRRSRSSRRFSSTSGSRPGASRIDANGDGKVDAAGAAIMDAAWPEARGRRDLAGARPADRPACRQLMSRSDDASPGGSSYIDGWYGYVAKDLRTLLGRPVRGPFATRFCGCGDLGTCRDALWAALGAAAADLAKAQGADATQWRADATRRAHRLHPGRIARHDALDEPADVPAGRHVRRASPPQVTRSANKKPCRDARYPGGDAQKRYLLTPGPTPVPPEVLAATAAPMIHHRVAGLPGALRTNLDRLQQVFRTTTTCFCSLPPGRVRSKSAVANLVSPGDRVLAVSHGEFGERWAEARRCLRR